MGNSSSYESPLLCPSHSPQGKPTCPAPSKAKKRIGDPRSPTIDFDRTPLRVQQISCPDPRSPSHRLPRTPISTGDENNQPQDMKNAAGKKKLFNIGGDTAPIVAADSLSS